MTQDWRQLDTEYETEKTKYPHPVPSRAFILQTLQERGEALSFSVLAKHFALNRNERDTFKTRIKAMIRDQQIEQKSNGKLVVCKEKPPLIGTVFAHPEGFGFFVADDKSLTQGDDLFLHYGEMRCLMHGDRVEVREIKSNRANKREAKIVRLLERANKTLIGRLIEINDNGNRLTIKPENRRILQAVIASNPKKLNADINDIVEVRITQYPDKYPDNDQAIGGELTHVLGQRFDDGIEIDIAIATHGIPAEWSQAVIVQTDSIPDTLCEADYQQREDLRQLPFVTIDGIDSRDFDDAVFARKSAKGYQLFVAIADVAHYVEKGSPLDNEAKQRATSVYFPNRVIPMLPEKLSNGLCSLNPNVDRLCVVCEMAIDHAGNLTSSRFYDAVMHSHARLTYDFIEDALFNGNEAILSDNHRALLPHLQDLKALYEILRTQRNQRGAIDFRTLEPEFEYTPQGKLGRILLKKQLKAYQLIEEFMVRANVAAAAFLLDKQKQGDNPPLALFRNHVAPSITKYDVLAKNLAREGIKAPKYRDETILPRYFADLVEQIKPKDNFHALQLLILYSMPRANYQAHNLGHFGLALTHYAHFTSPIRRYPDLLVHRAIKHAINTPDAPYDYSMSEMEALATTCSDAERRADDAVYDVIDFLKCEYMQDKVGQTFGATISNVMPFGFFAVLDELFIDGLVHVSSLDGDYFHFDDEQNLLIGERSRKVFKAGDKIQVIISKIDMEKRAIDFVLTDAFLPFGNSKGGQHPHNAPAKKHKKAKKAKANATKGKASKGQSKSKRKRKK